LISDGGHYRRSLDDAAEQRDRFLRELDLEEVD